MLEHADQGAVLLGLFLLALLSIYTVEKCRRDTKGHLSNPRRFLFEGRGWRYSIASNVGAVFSVTYFFGATFLYGRLYKGTMLVIAAAIFLSLFFLLPRLIRAMHTRVEHPPDIRSSNLMLEFLKQRLGRSDYRILAGLYFVIYFGLLVEELAVSRLILSTLFPVQPAVAAIMLTTICFVILAYLGFGGFRAILISDYVQLQVIVPFVLTLIFLIYRDSPGQFAASGLELPSMGHSRGANQLMV